MFDKQGYFVLSKINEIDAFGYVTDDSLNNGYKMLKKLANINPNVEQHIMINNSVYRKEVNSILESFGVLALADELLETDLKRVVEKIFSKK